MVRITNLILKLVRDWYVNRISILKNGLKSIKIKEI